MIRNTNNPGNVFKNKLVRAYIGQDFAAELLRIFFVISTDLEKYRKIWIFTSKQDEK